MTSRQEQCLLGIDTGGTYTDAVIFSHAKGVLAKAKSLTTKHDLSIGIGKAAGSVLEQFQGDPNELAFASISTTLATNALVEGKGNSVALIMIGFEETDLEKAGLSAALGSDPVIFLNGGHDVHGNETPLELDPLQEFVAEHGSSINAFAVVGMFAVRNASHELAVRDYLTDLTGLPCTCSHQLSSRLGGPKRALTTLLNARLVPMISHLIYATRASFMRAGLELPLMIVRGDGTMVAADFALSRPIETILSGPAASLVGVKQLTASANSIVSDIGGTTTDIAILEDGWPRVDSGGAVVGGFHTMVEAVAMHTFGLGGDSQVSIDEASTTGLCLGPKRLIPVSLLACEFEELVFKELKRQSRIENITALNGKFAWIVGSEIIPATLRSTESKLLERLTAIPQALDQLLRGSSELGTLNRLIDRGLVQMSGFTPSDASHVLGHQQNWHLEAATLAADLFARQKDRYGNKIASDPHEISNRTIEQLTRQSSQYILETCMAEDGFSFDQAERRLVERGLDSKAGLVNLAISLDRPLIGVGASAKIYYPNIGQRLNSECIIPTDSDVANAIGAVAGTVRIKRQLTITSSDGGNSFQILHADSPELFTQESEAIERAKELLKQQVTQLLEEAGAEDISQEISQTTKEAKIEDRRCFLEANLVCVGTGMPRID